MLSNRHQRNYRGENTILDWEVKTAALSPIFVSLKQALKYRHVRRKCCLQICSGSGHEQVALSLSGLCKPHIMVQSAVMKQNYSSHSKRRVGSHCLFWSQGLSPDPTPSNTVKQCAFGRYQEPKSSSVISESAAGNPGGDNKTNQQINTISWRLPLTQKQKLRCFELEILYTALQLIRDQALRFGAQGSVSWQCAARVPSVAWLRARRGCHLPQFLLQCFSLYW